MVSIGVSIGSAHAYYEARTHGNEKPTPTPPGDGRGNDTLEADKPRGFPHDRIYEHVTPAQVDDDDFNSYFGSLREQHFKQPEAAHADSDKPRLNRTDTTAGNDAEVFDHTTQHWQPTQNAGNGQYKALGDPYREAIDFEIYAGQQA